MRIRLTLLFVTCAVAFAIGVQSPARAIGAQSPAPRAAQFSVVEATIPDMQRAMQQKRVTSRELVTQYLTRIGLYDKHINAAISINPRALEEADARDLERARGRVRGPLHGIPILLKDNIDTFDRMQTTAGSLALEGNIAAKDAFIVKQLRKAGALILGKTNLSEWANFRGKRSISGWSSRGGLTRNPHALDRSA